MEPNETGILQKLSEIQRELKVEKKPNPGVKYKSRSKEDILEAAKPLCNRLGLVLLCDDEVVCVDGGWVYQKTTASLVDVVTGETVKATAWAREPESKNFMDESQSSGCAASYAGKRALGNLFALDDTKDADAYGAPADGQQKPQSGQPFIGQCAYCGQQYQFQSPEQAAQSVCQCGAKEFVAAQ